jgi:hypothetical protein
MSNRKSKSSLGADVSKQTFLIKTITLIILVTLINTISAPSQVCPLTGYIYGRITTSDGSGIEGVIVSGPDIISPGITNSSGDYTVMVVSGWSGPLSPSKSGYIFSPSFRFYPDICWPEYNQDYIGSLDDDDDDDDDDGDNDNGSTWILSGFVRTSAGSGVSDVNVSAVDQYHLSKTMTDQNGYYNLTVSNGWSGKVIPYKSGYIFVPPYKDYIDVTNYRRPQEFTAMPISNECLVAYWKLDETNGSVAYDSSGNGLDGTLYGDPQWQPSGGIVYGALDFDGIDDYVDCGNEPIFDIASNEMAVSAWVTIRSCTNAWQVIVSKGEYAWRLSTHNMEPRFHFGVTWWQSTDTYGISGETSVGFDEWHHVTGSFDGRNINIYLDGLLDGNTTTTEPIGISEDNVLIGNNPWDLIRFWDGLIDDVRIYDCVPSQTEIENMSFPSSQ